MVCRGSLLLLCLGCALWASGCRYAITKIEVGTPLSPEGYQAVGVGESSRADVLVALGAPGEIRYTLNEEIFEYRSAHHDGTDVEFMLPTALLSVGSVVSTVRGLAGSVVGRVVPTLSEPSEFARPWFFSIIDALFGRVFSSSSPISLGGEQALEMHGRHLRTSVIQVVLSRETNLVTEKSFLNEAHSDAAKDILRRSFLQE